MTPPKRRTISQHSEIIYDVHNSGIIIDTREIFVGPNENENIEYAMIDHKVANQFIRNIRLLDNINNNPILIHLITCGGDWNYSMAIYDAIKFSESETTTISYAHVRSMSSIIPQAATWRVIMPNADFLIHWGTNGHVGNYTSVQAEAKWAEKLSEKMLDIYVQKCKKGKYFIEKKFTDQKIRTWLRDSMDCKQEVYMTSRESVEKGFMDAVLGDENFENLSVLRE